MTTPQPDKDDLIEWLQLEIDGAVMKPERRERYRQIVEALNSSPSFNTGVAVTDAMIEAALHARVPGGAEVWNWLPQEDAWNPNQVARNVMKSALEAALSDQSPSHGGSV